MLNILLQQILVKLNTTTLTLDTLSLRASQSSIFHLVLVQQHSRIDREDRLYLDKCFPQLPQPAACQRCYPFILLRLNKIVCFLPKRNLVQCSHMDCQ